MTREEAIEEINKAFEPAFANYIITALIEGATVSDKALEQQPKIGHWIEVTNGRGGHECDVCHDYAPSFQSGNEYLSTFCPNCGARMVEPQESKKINCKSTKCENCINHNYCDYEPRESENKE